MGGGGLMLGEEVALGCKQSAQACFWHAPPLAQSHAGYSLEELKALATGIGTMNPSSSRAVLSAGPTVCACMCRRICYKHHSVTSLPRFSRVQAPSTIEKD